MSRYPFAPVCSRGHKKESPGTCRLCEPIRKMEMMADPVRHAEYKARNNKTQNARRAKRREKSPHIQAVTSRLLSVADYMASQERYGIIVKEMRYL